MSVPRKGSARLRLALRGRQATLRVRLAHVPGAAASDVHQARVECRRLRALLKTFRSFFAADAVRNFRVALGRVADLLAEIRELDVIAAQRPLQAGPWASELALARQRAVQRLGRRLASPANRAAVEFATHGPRLADLGLQAAITEADVLRRVRRSWRRVQRRLEPRPGTRRERHELRIRLKNCRYAIEIVSDVSPRATTALGHRLRAAQQNLGDQRDAEAAADWLRQRTGRAEPGRAALAALQRRTARLDCELEREFDRLLRAGRQWDRAITRQIKLGRTNPA